MAQKWLILTPETIIYLFTKTLIKSRKMFWNFGLSATGFEISPYLQSTNQKKKYRASWFVKDIAQKVCDGADQITWSNVQKSFT